MARGRPKVTGRDDAMMMAGAERKRVADTSPSYHMRVEQQNHGTIA